MEKLPPIEKIYEAYSALADKRYKMDEKSCEITSSNSQKTYFVNWNDNTYSSNDNASYWKGYAGYPIIAVLMIQGKLSYNEKIANYFKDVNWTSINKKYKAKYDLAVNEIITERNLDKNEIEEEVNKVFDEIKNLDIKTKRSSKRPPKGE